MKMVTILALLLTVVATVAAAQMLPENGIALVERTRVKLPSSEEFTELSKILEQQAPRHSRMHIAPESCSSTPTLSCNTTTTASPSCLGTEYYVDFYTINATAGQIVALRATTTTGYQELITIQDYSTGTVIASNYGPSPVTLTYTFPSSGPYFVGFGYVAKFATGTYSLSVTCGSSTPPPSSCQTAGTLTRRVPVSGSLGPADAVCADNKTDYYKPYQFTAVAGVPVKITLSASFPRYYMVHSDNSSTWLSQSSTPPEPPLIFYPTATGRQVVWVTQDLATPTTGTFTITIDDVADACNPVQPSTSGSCITTGQSMCLAGNRFAVSVAWKTPDGKSGAGTQNTLTSDSGYFWFFQNTNVELVVKVLDARAVNGKFWVFYGALSDVEYTISVRDTFTGIVKTYRNPPKNLASVADTSAF